MRKRVDGRWRKVDFLGRWVTSVEMAPEKTAEALLDASTKSMTAEAAAAIAAAAVEAAAAASAAWRL